MRGPTWAPVPHGRREAVPDVGELAAPETGPGHARQQQQQQETCAPEATTACRSRHQRRPRWCILGQRMPHPAPCGPPEIESADEEHDSPARGQPIRRSPVVPSIRSHESARHRLQVPLCPWYRAGRRCGIHEEGQLPPFTHHDYLGARVRCHRGRYLRRLASGMAMVALASSWSAPGSGWRASPSSAGVEQVVQLRLEQVDDAGEGEQDQEGGDEETGIEMPAPDPLVITCVLLLHRCSRVNAKRFQ